jgi:hypothetical protein
MHHASKKQQEKSDGSQDKCFNAGTDLRGSLTPLAKAFPSSALVH